jgi:hypothetical protein
MDHFGAALGRGFLFAAGGEAFGQAMGYGLKRYARVRRYQRALSLRQAVSAPQSTLRASNAGMTIAERQAMVAARTPVEIAARAEQAAALRTVHGNSVVARQFMAEELGWNWGQQSKALTGIDLTRPVQVRTLAAGTETIQYVRQGGPVGNWFTSPGTSAMDVGIAPYFRRPQPFMATGPVRVLESTAAKVFDTWSVRPFAIETFGGGTQWIANPGMFTPIP